MPIKAVVVDTNVWISALVFGGNPRKVFEKIISDGLTLVVSEQILAETRRILHAKLPDFIEDFEALLMALRLRTVIVKLGSISIHISRDPADNMVIETAVVGQADIIISGDDDLLTIQKYQTIIIIPPADFIKEVI